MQGGVIINREGFAYQKDLNILNARLSALEAEVASLRIAQQANTAICPVSAMQCVRARVIVECQTPDAPCQHRVKQQ